MNPMNPRMNAPRGPGGMGPIGPGSYGPAGMRGPPPNNSLGPGPGGPGPSAGMSPMMAGPSAGRPNWQPNTSTVSTRVVEAQPVCNGRYSSELRSFSQPMNYSSSSPGTYGVSIFEPAC